MSEDRCICCGEIVPEGRMVCPICEKGKKPRKCNHPDEAPACAFHYNGICTREHNYECPALAKPTDDVIEFVRCQDCKWSAGDCNTASPDWFCTYGERKEKTNG